jgi:hypothetical protein
LVFRANCALGANATQATKNGDDASSPIEIEQATPAKSPERTKKRKQSVEPPTRKRAKKAAAIVESDASDEEPVNLPPTRRRRQIVDSDDGSEDADQGAAVPLKENDTTQKSRGDDNQLEATKDIGESDSDLSSLIDEPPAMPKKTTTAAANGPAEAGSDSELSSLIDEPPARKPKKAPATKKSAKPPPKPAARADSDSELSSLLDEPPVKKKKKPAKAPPKVPAAAESDGKLSSGPDDSDAAPTKSPKRGNKSKGKPSSAAATDDVLKTLQTQLAKCGIRKQWKRELASLGSDKERAQHLRGLLREAGVTGRFSERLAREIRERRELEGEIRDAETFEKQWGLEAERAAKEAREKRRSAAQRYAELGFGSDDDEE